MNDMTSVIAPKSDQINADDLIGGDMTITITGVNVSPGQDQPVSIKFDGSPKVFRPCKSMSRVLVAVWGPDTSKYTGRSIQLYRDPDVTWGGLKVGGIRIRAMSDMPGDRAMTLALTEKRGSRKPAVIKPLTVERAPSTDLDPAVALNAAKDAASRGTKAFTAWWNGDGRNMREILRPLLDELKEIAGEADLSGPVDPFAIQPTPEQLAAEGGDALAAIRERDEAAS